MKLKGVQIETAVAHVRQLLDQEPRLTPAWRAAIDLIILIVTLLGQRLGLNSRNSSTPPSRDPHRPRQKKVDRRAAGGQAGHAGSMLKKVAKPDAVEVIEIDQRTLPRGTYHQVGFEARQVIDFEITAVVTEYRADSGR